MRGNVLPPAAVHLLIHCHDRVKLEWILLRESDFDVNKTIGRFMVRLKR